MTRDGRELQGFVATETPQAVIFVQIVQPPGRPTYGIEQKIGREEIASLTEVPASERLEMKNWYRRLRRQVKIDAGRADEVRLKAFAAEGREMRRYVGQKFVLESAAEESLVRRVVVRLEQTFAALEALLPAKSAADSPPLLTVRLFDARQEYDEFLTGLGLRLDNPAFYSAERRFLAVGSDLKRLAAELAVAEETTRQLRNDVSRLKSDLPQRLAQERRRLLAAKASPVQAERTLQELRNKLRGEITALSRRVDAAERKNNAVFDDATSRLFHALRHEALHAWLELHAYPDERYAIPRWLHEGLAQVLEAGVMEDGALRLDAPHAEALAALKADLRASPLPLSEVLRGDPELFLVFHKGGVESARRHYAYAWGLAHYLAYERRLMNSDALEGYVRRPQHLSGSASRDDSVARFEEFVGGSLAEFEREWRDYVTRL